MEKGFRDRVEWPWVLSREVLSFTTLQNTIKQIYDHVLDCRQGYETFLGISASVASVLEKPQR